MPSRGRLARDGWRDGVRITEYGVRIAVVVDASGRDATASRRFAKQRAHLRELAILRLSGQRTPRSGVPTQGHRTARGAVPTRGSQDDAVAS